VVTTGHARAIGSLVLVGLLCAILILAEPIVAPPPIPMRTEGHALDATGAPLPSGSPIHTFVDGVDYSNASRVQDAAGSFVVLTAGNSKTNANVSDTPTRQEGANLGDVVIYASGVFTSFTPVFRDVDVWTPGGMTTKDLTLGSSASTPQPLKIQGLVTLPARGGDQFVFLCNPTSSAVSLADFSLERDALGTYRGPRIDLANGIAAGATIRVNLTSPSWLIPSGDALKLVYRNPGGSSATAGGRDLVVDRVEFNATRGGTLNWEPANTIMGDAPAPGPGRILQRSGCIDTNSPADFALGIEPGLPTNGPPSLAIASPAAGEAVQGTTTVTIAWTMSDDVFLTDYLHVWANLTIGSQTIPLVVDETGVTSATWAAPDADLSDVTVHVDVADPFGEQASASRTFSVTRQSPVALVVAILIAVVLLLFLVFGLLRARKKDQALVPPPTPPTAPLGPAPMPPTAARRPTAADQKVCPRCHTIVSSADITCFFCGYGFPEESRPPP